MPVSARPIRRVALAVASLAATACVSTSFRTSPTLTASAGAIERVGLLPPLVTLYQEQVSGLAPELVRNEQWTRQAADNLRLAFAEELSAAHASPVEIDGEDPEIADVLDLFGAVDKSVVRHAYGGADEDFPEESASIDYSLGSIDGLARRQSVDAVWIIAGTELVPTAGAQARDAIEVLLAIAAAVGHAPAFTMLLDKLDLRAALVGRDGGILFFCRIGAGSVGVGSDGDLRSAAFARSVVRSVLGQYARATER